MRHARASACAHLALAEYEDLTPPRTRSPHRPRRAPLRTCTPERRVRVVRRASARSRCWPHAALASFAPSPSRAARLPARAAVRRTPRPRTAAALRTNAPRSPRSPHPREHGDLAHPRAAPASYPYPRAPRAPRSQHPPPHPREYGDSVSPRARPAPPSSSYLHPKRRVRVIHRASARSRCSAPRCAGFVRAQPALLFVLAPHPLCLPARASLTESPRALPAPPAALLLGLAPPCKRKESLLRPPRTCTPRNARARGASFVPDSPPANPRPRAGVVRAQARCTEMTRAASLARAEAGTERCTVEQATSARIPLGAAAPSTRAETERGAGC
ncbi:hypothetical protein DFH09DRAFT_1441154 [Mycena vulgaris]|nr:hypothetical protein DFH09DRAFT_1441154 [Mycena vulgaris]